MTFYEALDAFETRYLDAIAVESKRVIDIFDQQWQTISNEFNCYNQAINENDETAAQGHLDVILAILVDNDLTVTEPIGLPLTNSVIVTPANIPIVCDSEGTPIATAFTNSFSELSVRLASNDDTANWTFAVDSETNCTANILNDNELWIVAVSADNGYAEVRATKTGYADIVTTIGFYKSLNGESSYVISGFPDDVVVPLISGSPSYTNAIVYMRAILGNVDDTSNWTFAIDAVSNVAASVVSGNEIHISSITASEGYVDVSASKATYDTVVSRIPCYLYDFTDYYTKIESDARYYTQSQVDANTYTQTYIDANFYTQGQVDANTYTQTYIDANFYTQTYIDTNLYTQTQVDSGFVNLTTGQTIGGSKSFSSGITVADNIRIDTTDEAIMITRDETQDPAYIRWLENDGATVEVLLGIAPYDGPFRIRTNNALQNISIATAGVVDNFYMTNDGYIGIENTSPGNHKLYVHSSLTSGNQADAALHVDIAASAASDEFIVSFSKNSGAIDAGGITYGPSSIKFTYPSDRSLKQDIKPLNKNALALLNKIEVSEYRLKEYPNQKEKSVGYIANDYEGVIPGFIDKRKDTGLYSASQSVLVPYLHRAIQQLSGKVDSLEARLKKLEDKV